MVGKHLELSGRLCAVVALGCVLCTIACAGCATSASQTSGVPAKGTARAKDYTATGEYLSARAEALHATMAALPLNASSADVIIAHARSECAGVLRGTPAAAAVDGRLAVKGQVPLATVVLLMQIEESVFGRYTGGGWQAVTESAAQTFATQIDSIHWADPRITKLVRALVGVEAQLFGVPPIDVCRAIRNWAASGYKTEAVSRVEESLRPYGAVGRAWRRALLAVGCRDPFLSPTEKTVLSVLKPYERPGSAVTTRQIEKMETRLGVMIERSDRGRVDALMRVLGMPPRRRKMVKRKLTIPRPLPDCSSL